MPPDPPSRPPAELLERVEAWGMTSASVAYVYRPSTLLGLDEAFETARRFAMKVALKGGGNSYGDAFQCAEGVVLDLTRMNRILAWDPAAGVIRCEPGVTIDQLWRYTLGDGWWPPVVPGTAHVTLGGALAANIHGKNNFKAGPIGEHILSFELMTPNGRLLTCSPAENADVFYAAIGGFGLLGVIVCIQLQMKRIYSGLLNIEAVYVANWKEAFAAFEKREAGADYVVGWIDCFASDSKAGRGLIHAARYLQPEEDAHPEESLNVGAQELPDTVLRYVARSKLHRVMKRFLNRPGMRFINRMKCRAARKEHGKRYREPLAKFNFLLDSAPNWKFAYMPGGLIQYQCFIPKDNAQSVFERIITLSQERGIVPYLAVMKRHRPDPFLLSHAVDGYSLALDYKVTRKNRERVWSLAHAMDEIVLEGGGRFYLAKDSTLTSSAFEQSLTAQAVQATQETPTHQTTPTTRTIQTFLQLKRRLDPESLLQSELSKRLFGPLEPTSARTQPPPAERAEQPERPPHVEPSQDFELPEPFWAEEGERPPDEDKLKENPQHER
ncbi:MAG: FAD-binding oxidoreductase [Armatimonadetes bacterium]|nr:FAD-binding oxidoreductase [Armatimonadota bacterium]